MPYSVILRRLMQLTSSGVLWQGLRPCAVKCWGQGVPLLLVFLMPGFAPRVAQSFLAMWEFEGEVIGNVLV